jgi:hypothetical protein
MADRANYTTREKFKRAADVRGSDLDAQIDRLIAAASRHIERVTRTWFVPRTAAEPYNWPQINPGTTWELWVRDYLLSVSAITDEDGSGTITVANTNLEPQHGPPYTRVEIDYSSADTFDAGDTEQQTITVTGDWGYSNDTESAGTVVSGLASGTTATTFVTDSSDLIGVGDSLLIESERVFVTGKTTVDLAVNTHGTTGALTASKTDTNVTLAAAPATALRVGEILRINSEDMRITAINSTSDVNVERAYDGTILAAHSTGDDVYAYRTLTIERGINGSTAATHANATAVSRYVPPADVELYCLQRAMLWFHQERGGLGEAAGGIGKSTELDMRRAERELLGYYVKGREVTAV